MDRGEARSLPILNQVNSTLYMDFMELPKFAGHDYTLINSHYSRVYPLPKKVAIEGVLKEIFQVWIRVDLLPRIIHSDNDV